MKAEHRVVQELVKEFQDKTEELFQAFKMYGDDEDKRDGKIQIANIALWLSAALRNDVMETRFVKDHPDEEYETLEDKLQEIQKRLVRKGMEPASEDIQHILALISIDNAMYQYVKALFG